MQLPADIARHYAAAIESEIRAAADEYPEHRDLPPLYRLLSDLGVSAVDAGGCKVVSLAAYRARRSGG